jgi:mono/diheme cytochrome c family protein
MSHDSGNSDQKTGWAAEAERLANRYAMVTGMAVTFLLFGLIVVPAIVRERQAPKPAASDQPAAASVGWLDQAEAPPSKGKILPPVDPATVLTANPKLLARGEVLFKQNCTSCHGDAGRGDGPAVATLNPKPRNFTSSEKWTRGFRVTDIFTTVTTGVKGTGMAAFDFILPADRMALVHYVRSLGAFDHGPEDPAAIAALSDSFRSKEIKIPNKIPVSLAIGKMIKEQAAAPAPALPSAGDNPAAADLLRRVVGNPALAARTVAATTARGDLTSLARALSAGVPGNGFSSDLVSLGMDEWRLLATVFFGQELPEVPSPTGIDGGTP